MIKHINNLAEKMLLRENFPLITGTKIARHLYGKFGVSKLASKPQCIEVPDIASHEIYSLLLNNKPAMIARFGANELTCVANYLGVKAKKKQWLNYIRGAAPPWWWNRSIFLQMYNCAGFFPPDVRSVERFCEIMLADVPEVDLLGSWLSWERLLDSELSKAVKVDLELLNPYFSYNPWTQALRGKNVLVIHPFAETIKAQYRKRTFLHEDKILPEFNLKVIKAVQSIGGEKTEYLDWFNALDSMKLAMDQEEYDICLIGCGAYGFPLAAHAKRKGKKGFHLGGSLQLLFGIRGRRWEVANYHPTYNYANLINEHWVKPDHSERPKSADIVENGCYW